MGGRNTRGLWLGIIQPQFSLATRIQVFDIPLDPLGQNNAHLSMTQSHIQVLVIGNLCSSWGRRGGLLGGCGSFREKGIHTRKDFGKPGLGTGSSNMNLGSFGNNTWGAGWLPGQGRCRFGGQWRSWTSRWRGWRSGLWSRRQRSTWEAEVGIQETSASVQGISCSLGYLCLDVVTWGLLGMGVIKTPCVSQGLSHRPLFWRECHQLPMLIGDVECGWGSGIGLFSPVGVQTVMGARKDGIFIRWSTRGVEVQFRGELRDLQDKNKILEWRFR